MWDMKPTMEKMTNPANMLVQELTQQTIRESLKREEQREHFWVEGGGGGESSWIVKRREFHVPTCRRRCCTSCSSPVRWASPGPGRRRRRSEWRRPATPERRHGHTLVSERVCAIGCVAVLFVIVYEELCSCISIHVCINRFCYCVKYL